MLFHANKPLPKLYVLFGKQFLLNRQISYVSPLPFLTSVLAKLPEPRNQSISISLSPSLSLSK